MRLPKITGIIKRRILVNYRIDPEIIKKQLPAKLNPKLQKGNAIAGICLIRLEQIRPKGIPAFFGSSSENAAHRIAVFWDNEIGAKQEGVFIPRRDTNSLINSIGGGRLFPGEHHLAKFHVSENVNIISLQMASVDRSVSIVVSGKLNDQMPSGSCFSTLEEASTFFQGGSLGYSVTANEKRLDGLILHTEKWEIQPLEIQEVHSSYYSDESRFPKGSVQFDCALLMKNVPHEWHGTEDMYI